MKAPFAQHYPPLSGDIDAALTRLETAQRFDGLEADYELVEQEAKRRSKPAAIIIIPLAVAFVGAVFAAEELGWLPEKSYFAPVLVFPFVAILSNLLRGTQAVKDEMRLAKAIDKWRMQAGVAAVRRAR